MNQEQEAPRRTRPRPTFRMVQVARVEQRTPSLLRVTLTGPELTGYESRGPAEHIRLFYPQDGLEKPVICAVNGLCVGGGLHFVVDSDVVVAAESAAFMDTHVNVGMVGAIENVGLAKRLPLGAALRMTLMGRHYRMTARRAYELGRYGYFEWRSVQGELLDANNDLLEASVEAQRIVIEIERLTGTRFAPATATQ